MSEQGVGDVPPELTIVLKLGWSNPDTGPTSLRLYALDQGDQPRWAKPHARVAEVPLIEAGAKEGDRFILMPAEKHARSAADRLDKIASMHAKYTDAHGGTYGECTECGYRWPCPTYVWATQERDVALDPWDPADDEETG